MLAFYLIGAYGLEIYFNFRRGLLRETGHKREHAKAEDSDSDDFYDRTGEIASKRKVIVVVVTSAVAVAGDDDDVVVVVGGDGNIVADADVLDVPGADFGSSAGMSYAVEVILVSGLYS